MTFSPPPTWTWSCFPYGDHRHPGLAGGPVRSAFGSVNNAIQQRSLRSSHVNNHQRGSHTEVPIADDTGKSPHRRLTDVHLFGPQVTLEASALCVLDSNPAFAEQHTELSIHTRPHFLTSQSQKLKAGNPLRLGLCFRSPKKEEAGREGLISSAGRAWRAGACTRPLSFI